MLKAEILSVLGIVGGFIASLFGGWDAGLGTLLIFMAIDYLSGLVVAGVFHRSNKSGNGALESRAGFKGLCKKCMVLLFVLVATRLDMAMDTSFIRSGAVIAFTINEAISIVENAGLMGVPVPQIIKNAIDVLQKKGDDNA